MNAVIERATINEQVIAQQNLPFVRALANSFTRREEPVDIEVSDHVLVRLKLPAKIFKLLNVILGMMAEGRAFSLIPEDSEHSTQQAADMLNVSRPFLIKLLNAGKIPFKKVGTHRRILIEDLIAYTKIMETNREKALHALAKQAQELDLGY